MQTFCLESVEVMDKPTQDRFNHVDADLREISANLKETDKRLYELVGTVREIKGSVDKKSGEVHWSIRFVVAPLVVLLIAALVGLTYRSLDNRLGEVEESIKLIPSQIAAAQFSFMSPQELKQHRGELNAIKSNLVSNPRNIPAFWPVAFQTINLLSKATSSAEPKFSLLDITDANGSPNRTELFRYPPGSVLKLHKVIENITFRDAIVYLDSNVIIRNVTFINCTLILPDVQTPPASLENLGEQLLSASDLSNLTISSS